MIFTNYIWSAVVWVNDQRCRCAAVIVKRNGKRKSPG